MTIDSLAHQEGVSTGSIHSILHKDLQKSKRTAKFVPCLLGQVDKDRTVEVCKANLEHFEHEPGMIWRIITGDESSFCTFQPETKEMSKQWVNKGSSRLKKALCCATKKTTMLICFFDFYGIVHHKFVPQGTRVKVEFYTKVLGCLREEI